MKHLLPTKQTLKILSVVIFAAFMTACSSTQSNTATVLPTNNSYYQSIDASCEQQAIAMDNSAQQSGQEAQYLASANAMLRCVKGITFPKSHPDSDKALRLMALSVMNFVKGGDIDAANIALKKARSKFPTQDLYFADYSSFFDTATALLEQRKLTRHQLASLNISADLRAEIERKQYWLSH